MCVIYLTVHHCTYCSWHEFLRLLYLRRIKKQFIVNVHQSTSTYKANTIFSRILCNSFSFIIAVPTIIYSTALFHYISETCSEVPKKANSSYFKLWWHFYHSLLFYFIILMPWNSHGKSIYRRKLAREVVLLFRPGCRFRLTRVSWKLANISHCFLA